MRKEFNAVLPSDDFLRTMIDQMPTLAWSCRPDGSAEFVNQRWLDYTGLSMEEAVGWGWQATIHPEDLGKTTETWLRIVASEEPGEEEARVRRFDGEYRWFLFRAVPVRDEQQRGLSAGESFQVEQRVRRKDGQYRWFLSLFNPLRDDEGRIIRWYATGIDIEERKQAEERVKKENVALREEIDHSSMFEDIVGSSQALGNVLAQAAKVAPMDSTVLILGGTGTGKELIARAIHKQSKRSGRAFIRVNCAAIPTALIASELFGHEKGAFTGALQRHLGS